jgi:uncharacterized protein YkwD
MVHHYFLPHRHKNRHRKAHLLSTTAIVIYLSLFVFIQLGFASIKQVQPGVLGTTSKITRQQIIDLTNKEREKNGSQELKENSQLDKAAEDKARNMFEENYWAHNSPKGETPWVWIKNDGYDYVYAGENLARGFYNSNDVVAAWMASKEGHKENLLSTNFQEIGIAVEDGTLNGEKTTLVVQMFGSQTAGAVADPEIGKAVTDEAPATSKNVLGFKSSFLSQYITIDPYKTTRIIAISFIIFLTALGIVDLYLVWRRKAKVNLYTRHIPHLGLISALVIILILFKAGSII